ncbi:hypothetical protein CDO11_10070 [Xanthomonas oryzae pv. oryzae]|nr:hypothetical protein B9W05_04285 [Xanthomonas oryzae pv. oryzae]AXI17708.1 hypothetical protein CDO19_12170 [Xanthomonas oryzae pv. oryzae]AXI21353.1 hypothetical protein CDO11_10070 [Xanthomonas oryzae pv. oryzae]AXX67107.1 hypothetical protein B4599_09825 [Xanthomonas oryzae pv. oryzae]UMA60416.1 hypothetical protein BXU04_10090 [Xanthomonas oryzae pv. oryzae]
MRTTCSARAAWICAQGSRLASTASRWRGSIISAHGGRKKSAFWVWTIGKTPGNQMLIDQVGGSAPLLPCVHAG